MKKETFFTIGYKLAFEAFSLSLCLSLGYLAVEALLPGMLSGRVSLFPVFLWIILSGGGVILMGKIASIEKKEILSLSFWEKIGLALGITLFIVSVFEKIIPSIFITLFLFISISSFFLLGSILTSSQEKLDR